MSTTARADWRTPTAVLICGGMILTLALGLRHGFGLFLQPMTSDLHWGRESFALALAVQNLVWGASQPFAGMIADKYGAGRVTAGGAVLYIAGLALMAYPFAPWFFVLSSGVLIGMGLSGVTFSLVLGVIGRRYPPEKRSMALGIAAAAGSFGQFAMLPLTQWLLTHVGWHGALLTMAGIGVLMIPLALGMVEDKSNGTMHAFVQSAGQAMREALGHRGYMLLTVGFFVCGFQVVFVGVHLPAFLADRGFPPHAAVISLALIGLFNIVGTYTTGWLGGRMPKRWILSGIYFGRSIVIALFILLPMSLATVYGFAVLLGLLWLSTVPPTNGIVAAVFGTRYLAMLAGFTFFSHQIGSFLGAWLGGLLYDRTGSYDVVWWISIALGIVAGLMNLPIDEREIRRPQAAVVS
ncbi:MAG TPA: MFS transporter [Casimicrobiaceae bacterium]|jgi:predicted MFS family arabinose efflux permease